MFSVISKINYLDPRLVFLGIYMNKPVTEFSLI